MAHTIEAEIRAEIKIKDISKIKRHLARLGYRQVKTTRRTSIMFFGEAHAKAEGWDMHRHNEVDIRCRVTNGQTEVVGKVGSLHAANRIEIPIQVDLDDMLEFSKLFCAMGFYSKVGSRLSEEWERGKVTIALVWSPKGVAYIELEKITTRKNEKVDIQELEKLAQHLKVTTIKSRDEYAKLVDKLNAEDWLYHATAKDIIRFKQEIRKLKSDRK